MKQAIAKKKESGAEGQKRPKLEAAEAEKSRPKIRAKYNWQYTREALEDAVNSMNHGLTLTKAANKYGIPKTTLADRYRKNREKKTAVPSCYITEEQEKNICELVLQMADLGYRVEKKDLSMFIKQILDHGNFVSIFRDNTPSKQWINTFLGRHRKFKQKFSQLETMNLAPLNVEELDFSTFVKNNDNGKHVDCVNSGISEGEIIGVKMGLHIFEKYLPDEVKTEFNKRYNESSDNSDIDPELAILWNAYSAIRKLLPDLTYTSKLDDV